MITVLSDSKKYVSESSNNIPITGKLDENLFINYNALCSFGAYISLDSCLQNEEIMERIGMETGLTGKTFIIQVRI